MNDSFWVTKATEIAQRVIQAPGEFSPEQSYPCPVCGNRLIIHLGRYQRDTVKMLGVTVECKECNQAMAIDLAETEQ
jgi:hypothetical protein